MSTAELSRLIRVRKLPGQPLTIEANATECAAIAARFGLAAVHWLGAQISLEQRGKAVVATGKLGAQIEQVCAVSGEVFAVSIEEAIELRFVEEVAREDPLEEIELAASELDEIEYAGETIDLGEAVAQTLGLAIDPYAVGPGAAAARKSAGITDDTAPTGPLAEALRGLAGKPD